MPWPESLYMLPLGRPRVVAVVEATIPAGRVIVRLELPEKQLRTAHYAATGTCRP